MELPDLKHPFFFSGPGINRRKVHSSPIGVDYEFAFLEERFRELGAQFAMAMDRYKKVNQRPYPNWSEVLWVMLQLGWTHAGVSSLEAAGSQEERPESDGEAEEPPASFGTG